MQFEFLITDLIMVIIVKNIPTGVIIMIDIMILNSNDDDVHKNVLCANSLLINE